VNSIVRGFVSAFRTIPACVLLREQIRTFRVVQFAGERVSSAQDFLIRKGKQ
jgi:hypothetical protein